MTATDVDIQFMTRAMALADEAAVLGEVPVGAVVVIDGDIVGEGHNRQIIDCDPSAHAEVIAMRDAATRMRNYRLPGATLYVTLEPCTMCCGALVHARIARLVFAAREPKAGAVVSADAILDNPALNHRVQWEEGVLREQSASMLQAFFRARRR